jgi:hypothetical protein
VFVLPAVIEGRPRVREEEEATEEEEVVAKGR